MTRTPDEAGITLRPLLAADTHATGRLHYNLLPEGFFARLGPQFLASYHRTFALSPHGVALVATCNHQPVGALVGTTHNGAHHRWLLRRHGAQLTARGLAGLATNPAEIPPFVRARLPRYIRGGMRLLTRRHPAGTPVQQAASPPDPEVAVLHHVFVDPKVRGAGAGTRLTDAFLEAAGATGVSEARLVTLTDGGAAAFYTERGWRMLGRRADRDGRGIVEFAWTFDD